MYINDIIKLLVLVFNYKNIGCVALRKKFRIKFTKKSPLPM